MKFRLTREQRAAFFAGQCPHIGGEGQCPVEKGYEYRLSSKLSFTVLAVRRRKDGGWSLHYEVLDRRDPVRLLRRTPAPQDFEAIRKELEAHGGYPPPTSVSVDEAAQESAYTSDPTASLVADAGEGVDEVTQRRLANESQRDRELRRQRELQHRRELPLEERLRHARVKAAMKGRDISKHVRVIERRLEAIEDEENGKAA